MNNVILRFTAYGADYYIAHDGEEWHLYSVGEDLSEILILTSWYPGDVLSAAIDIQNSVTLDDDTEDMPPRGIASKAASAEPSWNLEAEIKI